MSVITKIGQYVSGNGGKASILLIDGDMAYGRDSSGDPAVWVCENGDHETDRNLDIAGPWHEPPTLVDLGEGWEELSDTDIVTVEHEFNFKENIPDQNSWCEIMQFHSDCGKTYAEAKTHYGSSYVVRRRIRAPFRISDHGCGIYLTRDGREVPIFGRNGDRWVGRINGGDPTWGDDGAFVCRSDSRDLIRYLCPLPESKWTATNDVQVEVEVRWVDQYGNSQWRSAEVQV